MEPDDRRERQTRARHAVGSALLTYIQPGHHGQGHGGGPDEQDQEPEQCLGLAPGDAVKGHGKGRLGEGRGEVEGRDGREGEGPAVCGAVEDVEAVGGRGYG